MLENQAIDQIIQLEENHFWFRGRRSIFLSLIQKTLKSMDNNEILDIGCGNGGFLKRLAAFGNVIGAEFNHTWARSTYEGTMLPIVCSDATSLPIASGSFNLVCLFDVLEHIEREQCALQEASRVLKPEGVLFISVPAYQYLYSNNDRVSNHFRRYTRSRLRKLIEQQDLNLIRSSYFNTLLFPLILPIALFRKLTENLRLSRDETRTNLSIPIPHWINELCSSILECEARLLSTVDFPFGHSLLAVARKKSR